MVQTLCSYAYSIVTAPTLKLLVHRLSDPAFALHLQVDCNDFNVQVAAKGEQDEEG